ncbi:hypothetical protein ACIBUR_02035 [Streptomyces anulatus]
MIPPQLHAELLGSGYLDAAMPTAPVGTRVWLTRQPGGPGSWSRYATRG